MAFRFRLQTADGIVLGDREFAVPDWKQGDVIALGGVGTTYRVLERVEPGDVDGLPILVVEPAQQPG